MKTRLEGFATTAEDKEPKGMNGQKNPFYGAMVNRSTITLERFCTIWK